MKLDWTKIDRRKFLKGVTALGAMAALPSAMPGRAFAADDGTLRYRNHADMQSMDPAFSKGLLDEDIHANVYNKLIQFKPGSEWGYQLDAAATVLPGFGLDQIFPDSFQTVECSDLILTHKTRILNDINRNYRCQVALQYYSPRTPPPSWLANSASHIRPVPLNGAIIATIQQRLCAPNVSLVEISIFVKQERNYGENFAERCGLAIAVSSERVLFDRGCSQLTRLPAI